MDLRDVIAGKFRVEGIQGMRSMEDGEHYTRIINNKQIKKYSFRTGEEVATVFDVATARDCNFEQFDGYIFSPDEKKILIRTNTQARYRRSYTAVYYIYDIRNNRLETLSDGGPQEAPQFSPDGHQIAFVRDNNIFLVKLLFGNSESQVTEDGEFNKVLNGVPDWVYEEEFSMNSAFEFSPDNNMIAYIRFEETEVPMYSIQMWGNNYPDMYSYKYPKTGERNSKVSVHTFDIKSRVTRKVNLPVEESDYIPRIRFTSDPTKMAIITLNRTQNKLDLYFADPRSTVCKLILREESAYYIDEDALDNIRFYENNFTLISERNGYKHLYWYNFNGGLVKQVTQGDFEVQRFIGWDKVNNSFYFEANVDGVTQNAVYKTGKKGELINLSGVKGTNSGDFSKTFKYFIHTHSNISTPPLVEVKDNTGKTLRTLVDNAKLKTMIEEYNLPTREMFTFKTSQGITLNGWMIKPAGFSASKKYPVIMFQYSGPGSQQVLDRWRMGGQGNGIGWDHYMANQGYIMVCVDGRGTGGRGEEFQKCTYLNLGVKEAKDQVEAAQYMGTLPYVDKTRIGIWGWSYGGYTTIMSMSEGTPVFKAGVAVAPVTDWKYYDSIYGERYMRTPNENPEGYKAASAFTRADKLNGRVLLVHGTADDNVHLQNLAEYTECLIQLDKPFDMHYYTNRDHGIYGGNTRQHLFAKITRFFLENL
ncbi:S9 family peptidase [Bacteroides sp. 214]|uniref:S9 family peptidase n=1 Tax=Bacteroides sp. 214 TaxID=2302935 RepID=UPI00351BCD46